MPTARLVQRLRRPYTRQTMRNLHIFLFRNSSLFGTNVHITVVLLNFFGGRWGGSKAKSGLGRLIAKVSRSHTRHAHTHTHTHT